MSRLRGDLVTDFRPQIQSPTRVWEPRLIANWLGVLSDHESRNEQRMLLGHESLASRPRFSTT